RIDPRERARLRELRLRNEPASLAAALAGLGTGALPSLWHRLGEIRTPTLLLVGALDRKYVEIAHRMAAALPDARVVEVSGAGHTVHLERPAAWVAAVADFLRST
ncbi:MAG TPA: alpha/beta fold hydrolase, partial [Longimicrobiales bacterium]|nr:alpha/beta fold hydrolase [Longimicrobiales bacterium]